MTQKNKTILGLSATALVVAAVLVKLLLFPSIEEEYFATVSRTMERVPSGLVVVRPTQFGKSSRKGVFSTPVQKSGGTTWRLTGRDVTFKALVATAYSKNEAHIELPWDAPKINYDFLVTVANQPQAHLQAAIRKELGFTAESATREKDVLALKVENPDLPGMTPSGAGESENVDFHEGKLHFTHMRPGAMMGGLEQVLKMPVVDKTGLTNFYNFSVAWDNQTQRQLNSTNASAVVKKIVGGWGLALKPDTASVETLVVKKLK